MADFQSPTFNFFFFELSIMKSSRTQGVDF